MMQVKTVIVGVGNVGRRLLELVERKKVLLRERFGLELVVVAVADSSGARMLGQSAELHELIGQKAQGKKIAEIQAGMSGAPAVSAHELLQTIDADLLVELSPTNLQTGEPGLSLIRTALGRKMNVVTANKGPMVLAFQELTALAEQQGSRLLYSATVTGGLPTLNIGRRDLGACEFTGFEGVVNATTNYILTTMLEGGSYEAALKHAQEVGHAEADPSLDVDGWDAANKLVIIANAVLRQPTRLQDVEVEGIRGVTPEQLQDAREHGEVIKLLARAERIYGGEGDYRLSVKPTRLPQQHALARIGAEMMGIVYHTDINGTILSLIEERDPYPTAAAVLRDMVNASVA
ncbi:MAG: homoserine dehydrogenase [Anaerolineae bacterium]